MKKSLLFFALTLLLSLYAQEDQSQQEQELPFTDTPKELTLAQKKSGFVVGVEALFGSSTIHHENVSQSSSGFSLMGGFYGGYQHYFDDHFGIRALLSVHDGTPIIGNVDLANQTFQISALPFWVGTQLDVLWDFWQKEEHTLGISAGLGYNFETYHAREAKINQTTYTLSNLYQHNLYPIIGFHYYYGHHQMSLNYRFIGTLNSPLKEYFVAGIPLKTKYNFTDYLNFSYTYRF
ncbi:outer membrane beta-barrel protein [Helicobacter kayseriensis]|uniref:outer membrane beta-barrel protein n=1 Tax=Helicobacter kayseriensis TaxID=2905877 RepID=UPI001E45A427|nr:outer membrane beta-barrel protein [Helicobacter kayseriensis]MCE3047345.1 outer membrane beta-barrel protein [Helicobacter kayseriensis]MCE3048716.1 outer membrane beta-barrel protein [Helicobacter kayseriensis]